MTTDPEQRIKALEHALRLAMQPLFEEGMTGWFTDDQKQQVIDALPELADEDWDYRG